MKPILAAGRLAAAASGLAAVHAQTRTGSDGLIHYRGLGIDLAGGDRAVAPGDDLHARINRTWARDTSIPADTSGDGVADAAFQPKPGADAVPRARPAAADLASGAG